MITNILHQVQLNLSSVHNMLRWLAQSHALPLLRNINRFCFSEVLAKKKVDKSKACIRLMMEWPEMNLEIDRLK